MSIDLNKTLSTIEEDDDEDSNEDDYMERKLERIVDACEDIGYSTEHLYDRCLVHNLDLQTVIAIFYRLFYSYEARANEEYDLDEDGRLYCSKSERFDTASYDLSEVIRFGWEFNLHPKPLHNPYHGYSKIVETGMLVPVDSIDQVNKAREAHDLLHPVDWFLQPGPYTS